MQSSRHAIMKPDPSLKISDLLGILGYEPRHSKQKAKVLTDDIDKFFKSYQANGNPIPATRTRCEAAVRCARQYLEEDSRAEKFWPANEEAAVLWPTDRECIVETVGHIFRRKAVSAATCAIILRNTMLKKEGILPTPPKKIPREKGWKRTRTRAEKSASADLKEVLKETKVKPWTEPPNEPGTKACIEYIQHLDPAYDQELTGFTNQWLANDDAEAAWPTCAKSRLERFMHDHDFYISSIDQGRDETSDRIRFANSLRQGTEIENIDSRRIAIYMRRFGDEIKQLSSRLAREPSFVLAFSRDGTVHKTAKFDRLWNRKQEHWTVTIVPEDYEEEIPRPAKRRKRNIDVECTANRLSPKARMPTPNISSLSLSYSPSRASMDIDREAMPPQFNRSSSPTTAQLFLSRESMYRRESPTYEYSPESDSSGSASWHSINAPAPEPLVLNFPASGPATQMTAEKKSSVSKFESPETSPCPASGFLGFASGSRDMPIMLSDDEPNSPRRRSVQAADQLMSDERVDDDSTQTSERAMSAARSWNKDHSRPQRGPATPPRSVSDLKGDHDLPSGTNLHLNNSRKATSPTTSSPVRPVEMTALHTPSSSPISDTPLRSSGEPLDGQGSMATPVSNISQPTSPWRLSCGVERPVNKRKAGRFHKMREKKSPESNASQAAAPALVPAPIPTESDFNPSNQEPSPRHAGPNNKTLELIIAYENGGIGWENIFPFQQAQDSKLTDFFDFYSTVARVPISRLNKLHFTVSFGKRQPFDFERHGDAANNERLWKRSKDLILTLFMNAQKACTDQNEFMVLVEMTG